MIHNESLIMSHNIFSVSRLTIIANDTSPYEKEKFEIEKTPINLFVPSEYNEDNNFAHGDIAILVFNGSINLEKI